MTISTISAIPLTEEVGISFKNFRNKYKVTAKDITEQFNKFASYITKLENGTVKKIEVSLLKDMCNYITQSSDGLYLFTEQLASNYTKYTEKTKLLIMNLDDVFVEYRIPEELVSEINSYITKKNIALIDIANKINENEDINDKVIYSSIPSNIWVMPYETIEDCVIKFEIPSEFVYSIFNSSQQLAPRVFLEVLLYKMYKLGGEENPREYANSKLRMYKITSLRYNAIDSSVATKLIKDLDPDTIVNLDKIFNGLQLVASMTGAYGKSKTKNIAQNLQADLGFSFSYMAMDISQLKKKSKDRKQAFINDLRALIQKYSTEDTPETEIDLYD